MNYFSGLTVWDKFGMLQREILLYNALAKEFKNIYIFSYGGKKELEYAKYLEKNITVIPKTWKIPDVVYEFLLPFIHRKILKNCDIYKTNQNSGAIAPTIAKIIYGKKLVVRSGYIGSEFAKLNKLPLYAKLYFWFAENFSYFFCNRAFIPTQSGYDILIKKYPVLKDKLIIMNNFIDIGLFKKNELGKKYDIIYVARFDGKQKNHIGLLEAAEGLGLKLLFVGQGKKKDFIMEKAQEKNISLEIIEKIPNDQLPGYYNASRMCVFPSFFEGNPKALLEAMGCELPIVACDVTGVNNLIKNGDSGLLSAPDSGKIRENIEKIQKDEILAKNLGGAAREFVVENFSFKKLLEKEINIYKNVLFLN